MKRRLCRKLRRLRKRWFHEFSEPHLVKNPKYRRADRWLKTFLESKMDPGDLGTPEPTKSLEDPALAAFTVQIANTEHNDAADAYKQLVSKAYEQLKICAAIISGYAVLARWLIEGVDKCDRQIIGFFAIIALVTFFIALLLGLACVRGLPYMPSFKVSELLDWAEPDKSVDRLKILASAYMHRRVEGNRHCNNWIADRITRCWQIMAVGFLFVIVSIAIRLIV